jgi:hypothetical protein
MLGPQFSLALLKFISDTKWLSLITETYLEDIDAHTSTLRWPGMAGPPPTCRLGHFGPTRAPQAVGRIWCPTLCDWFNHFSNLVNSQKIVQTSKICKKLVGISWNGKVNLVWTLVNNPTHWAWPNSPLCSILLYKVLRTQMQEYLFTNIYTSHYSDLLHACSPHE